MDSPLAAVFFGLMLIAEALGPLLLLPAAWLLQWLLRPLVRHLSGGRLAARAVYALGWAVAALLLGTTLVATWYPGHAEFERLCLRYAIPQIAERVKVDGFYRERLQPHETQRLFEQGFTFIETQSPRRTQEKRLLRYRPGTDGEPMAEEVNEHHAGYGVSITYSHEDHGITRTEKRIHDLSDGRLLARAGEVVFVGGLLQMIFLGTSAVAKCPDTSDAREIFHDFEAIVLGDLPLPTAR